MQPEGANLLIFNFLCFMGIFFLHLLNFFYKFNKLCANNFFSFIRLNTIEGIK